MGAPANTTVLQTQRRAAEMELHGDAIRGSAGRMPTQPTADLLYINVKIDGISLMVKALHDSSSTGINATGGHFLGNIWSTGDGKGKVFPYSLPSVGPGADPGVQAVSPQVT